MRDVPKRRKFGYNAQRLRELAAIVEWSNDAVVRERPDGTITSWNPAAEQMYGWATDQVLGRPIEMIESEEKRGEIRRLLAGMRAEDRVIRVETVHVRADGSQMPVLLTISPTRDEDGRIVGAAAIAHDLTELRAAEDARRRSEESYRQLFERHPAPIWVYDPRTLRFLAVNDATLEATGYARTELLEMTIADFLQEDGQAKLRGHLDTEGEPPLQGAWELRARDGSRREVATSAVAIDFEGREARLVLAQDITAQRRLEEQLRQTQKMEAIGRLAGGIAHDFNNLLLVIRGYSQLLLECVTGGERDYASQIDKAAERASDFTRQLRAFSRHQVFYPEAVDLNEIVRETLGLLSHTLEASIAIEAELDPELGAILVDRSELSKAILNLAINARDAMPDGGLLQIRTTRIRVGHAEVRLTPGSYAILEVTDSGIGMDEETRRRALEPFFTTKDDGTGLGLASVYGLTTQSGGDVWLYSEPGIGTTFKLYFPLAGVETAPPAPREDEGELTGEEVILLVEDTQLVRELIAETLESLGYEVLAAANGEHALALAESFPGEISLLLTDIVMPGMHGGELAERLVEVRPQLKVLFTSGDSGHAALLDGGRRGHAAFIDKPFLPRELARAIRRIFDEKTGAN